MATSYTVRLRRATSQRALQMPVSPLTGQIKLDRPIKTVGMHSVRVDLHPEVSVEVIVNVARTEEEADIQARGNVSIVMARSSISRKVPSRSKPCSKKVRLRKRKNWLLPKMLHRKRNARGRSRGRGCCTERRRFRKD